MRCSALLVALAVLLFPVKTEAQGMNAQMVMVKPDGKSATFIPWVTLGPVNDLGSLVMDVRYNFDSDKTFAAHYGATFNIGDVSFTPMAGGLLGNYNGLSLQLTTSYTKGRVNAFLMNQYSVGTWNNKTTTHECYQPPIGALECGAPRSYTDSYNFNFNYGELSVVMNDWLTLGLAGESKWQSRDPVKQNGWVANADGGPTAKVALPEIWNMQPYLKVFRSYHVRDSKADLTIISLGVVCRWCD